MDAVVQSTDKNFMVPVGGAVVTSGASDTSTVDAVRKSYPGRASASPVVDLLVTLLSMGADGWRKLLREREETYAYMRERLRETAAAHGERVLDTPGNPISIGVTLSGLAADAGGTRRVRRFSDPCSSREPCRGRAWWRRGRRKTWAG